MRLSPNQQGTDRKDDYETNVWSQQSADVQLMCLYILYVTTLSLYYHQ